MGITSGAVTANPTRAPEFILSFGGVRVTRSLVLCVVFCRSLFLLLYFFFCPLGCLPFFDVRIYGFLLLLWHLPTLLIDEFVGSSVACTYWYLKRKCYIHPIHTFAKSITKDILNIQSNLISSFSKIS